MRIKVFVQGKCVSLFGPDASGLQRVLLLDAVLGRYAYPDGANTVGKPGLLRSWEVLEGGKRWKLTLDSSLTFHNGRKVTALDLEYSLLQPLCSKFETPERSGLKDIIGADEIKGGEEIRHGLIEGIRVVDDETVEITLNSPDPFFLANIRVGAYSLCPKESLNPTGSYLSAPSRTSGSHIAWQGTPVGCGPYKVANIGNGGCRVFLERVGSGANNATNIEIYSGEYEPNTDLVIGPATNPDPSLLKQIDLPIPWVIFGLFFRYESALVRDQRFRAAIWQALDREELSKIRKSGTKTDTIIPSNWPEWNFSSNRNKEKSESLFSEVLSLSKKQRLCITVPPAIKAREQQPWIETMVSQIEECGCKIDLVDVGQVDANCLVVANLSGFIPSVSSPVGLFSLFEEGSGWVPQLDKPDEKYTSLLSKLRSSPESRDTETVQSLNRRFQEMAFAIPFFEDPVSCFVNPAVVESLEPERQDTALLLDRIKIR